MLVLFEWYILTINRGGGSVLKTPIAIAKAKLRFHKDKRPRGVRKGNNYLATTSDRRLVVPSPNLEVLICEQLLEGELVSVLLVPKNGHYVANLNERDAPQKTLVVEKQEEEIVANIRFYKDRKVSGNQYFGITDDGVIVFPNIDLLKAITERGLGGHLLSVILQPKTKKGSGTPQLYIAHVENLLHIPHSSKLNWGKVPTALLIDGQNLLGEIRSTHRTSLDKTVKKVQCLASFKPAKMFFCSSSGQSQREWVDQLVGIEGIELVDRLPKFINGHRGKIRKEVDIDASMLPEIVYLKLDASIEGLMVVTGDSDYEKALRMYAGVGEYKNTGQRFLRIISWSKSLSRELRALGNYPNIEVIELEDLI